MYLNEGVRGFDDTDYIHTIIRVTMKNGETYSLDMAGAQYGWHESVVPWKLYTTRVREVKEVLPFGGTKIFCKTRAKTMGPQREWIHSITEIFAKYMDGAITWWQTSNISTADLLRLPEYEFQKKKTSLMEVAEDHLRLCKTLHESRGYFEIEGKFNEGPDREVTSA